MSLRSNLILLFALITGMAMAFAVRSMLQAPGPDNASAVQTDEPQVPVMIAKTDLAVGEELTPQNIRFERFAESGVPWDAIFHFQDVTGRTLIKPVKAGKLISLKDLNDPDANKQEINSFMKPGYQPVAIQIDSIVGKGESDAGEIKSLVLPDDLVTLSAIVEDKEEETGESSETKPHQRKLVTKPLLENVPVFKVAGSQRVADNFGTLEKIALVYLLLDTQQLKRVNEAADSGNLILTVQKKTSEEDQKPVLLRGSTPENLPAEAEPVPEASENEKPAAEAPADPAAPVAEADAAPEPENAADQDAPKKPSPFDVEAPKEPQAAPQEPPKEDSDTENSPKVQETAVSYHAPASNKAPLRYPPVRAARRPASVPKPADLSKND